jgi:quinoprotein glucose dehydrogenase
MKTESLRWLPTALALCFVSIANVPAQQAGASWKDYLGGPDSSHYSPLRQITPSNVDKLEIAWSYPLGDEGLSTFSPLVIDNIAYVAAKGGALVALDAETATNSGRIHSPEEAVPTA